jgi:hypothetical protein
LKISLPTRTTHGFAYAVLLTTVGSQESHKTLFLLLHCFVLSIITPALLFHLYLASSHSSTSTLLPAPLPHPSSVYLKVHSSVTPCISLFVLTLSLICPYALLLTSLLRPLFSFFSSHTILPSLSPSSNTLLLHSIPFPSLSFTRLFLLPFYTLIPLLLLFLFLDLQGHRQNHGLPAA